MKVAFNASLAEIAGMSGGTLMTGSPASAISSISSDSRDIDLDSLFVPLVGERFDGHDFIRNLCEEKKTAAFLTMKKEYASIAEENNIGAVLCADTLTALGSIAAAHRRRMSPCIVGITGTNGKTTTKELVYAFLKEHAGALRSEKNYNNEIGVPFTLLGLRKEHRLAVIEMGMNHSGELQRLSAIVRPDIAVITNVGEGHLEFLGSVENVAYAKAEIMTGMTPGSVIFLNRDSECFELLFEQARKSDLHVKSFGLTGKADYYPQEYHLSEHDIEMIFRGERIKAPLYGLHNVYNILAALAVALEIGIAMPVIVDSIKNFDDVGGRSSIIDRGYIIIDDTYNANPLSTRYALKSAAQIFKNRKKIAVLSDMKELGKHAESFHREIGKEVALSGFDVLCLWGSFAEVYRDGAVRGGMAAESVHLFDDKKEMMSFLKKNLTTDDIVLVKGSRSMGMEEVVRDITG